MFFMRFEEPKTKLKRGTLEHIPSIRYVIRSGFSELMKYISCVQIGCYNGDYGFDYCRNVSGIVNSFEL